jgi:transposase
VGVDATTLEANAAMPSIVRRDSGESYEEFLIGLAKASGIETPTREDLARLDRKRNNKSSNQDWQSPSDPDAKITKMKDGTTHLAHKAEHAVDLETGAVVAATLQGADQGDTTTLGRTVAEAGEQIATVLAHPEAGEQVNPQDLEEVVADKGYHSNATQTELREFEVRSYISEPKCQGRRKWIGKSAKQAAVYGNRRRIGGTRGKRLLRRRGELVERSFAHLYETGGMRRAHLRGHASILKRLLIHAGAFNLGLILRQIMGVGKPRRLQGSVGALFSLTFAIVALVFGRFATWSGYSGFSRGFERRVARLTAAQVAA